MMSRFDYDGRYFSYKDLSYPYIWDIQAILDDALASGSMASSHLQMSQWDIACGCSCPNEPDITIGGC